jgi:hypothetical protein
MNAVAPAVASMPIGPAAKSGMANGSPAESQGDSPADFAALLSGQMPPAEEMAALLPEDLRARAEGPLAALGEEVGGEAPVETEPLILQADTTPIPNAAAIAFAMPNAPQPVPPAATLETEVWPGAGGIRIGDAEAELKDLASDLEALLNRKGAAEQTPIDVAANEALRDLAGHPLSQPHEAMPKQSVGQDIGAIASPLHTSRWSQDFSQKLVWMVKNDIQNAQLSINPANLGPIEITLTIGKDSASAHFASPFAEVREVLEAALPRLKEMLAEAGVDLGQANVGAQSQNRFAENHAQRQAALAVSGRENASFPANDAVIEARVMPLRGRGIGMVDTFA